MDSTEEECIFLKSDHGEFAPLHFSYALPGLDVNNISLVESYSSGGYVVKIRGITKDDAAQIRFIHPHPLVEI